MKAQTGIGLEGHAAKPGGTGFFGDAPFMPKKMETLPGYPWLLLLLPLTPSSFPPRHYSAAKQRVSNAQDSYPTGNLLKFQLSLN